MKRKKDRSGSVALAATAIVIVLVGASLFSVYSLAKHGYINLPFNLSAKTTDTVGTGVPAGADEAAEDIVKALPSGIIDAVQEAAGPISDSPLRITGVIDLNSRTPSNDTQAAQDTVEEPAKEEVVEESVKEEPAVQEPVNKELSAEPAKDETAAPELTRSFPMDEEPVYTAPVYSEPEQIVYADLSDSEDVQIPELSAAEEYAATHLGLDYSEPAGDEYTDEEEAYEEPAFAYAEEEEPQDMSEEEPYEEELYYEEFDEETSYEEVEEEPFYAGLVSAEPEEDYYEEESYYEEDYYEEESYYEEDSYEEDYYEEDYYEEDYYEEDYYEEVSYYEEEYSEESYDEGSFENSWWDESLYNIWTDDAGVWIQDIETGEIFNSEIGPDPYYQAYDGSDDWYEESYEDDWYEESYEDDWYEESYEDDWYEESYEDDGWYEEDYGSDYWSDPRYEVWTDDAGVWIVDTETGETFNAEVGPDPNYGSYEDDSWEDGSESYEDDWSEESSEDDWSEESYEDDWSEESYEDDWSEESSDDYDDEDYDDEDYYEEIYYTLGEQIVDYALGFVGVTPYVWGGNSLYGGTDCSGFVHLIFADFGIYCSHASLDYNGGSFGYIISYDELQPGDIVVYGGGDHVAIYAGNGYVVHCSSPENGTVYWNMNYRSDISWFLRVIY